MFQEPNNVTEVVQGAYPAYQLYKDNHFVTYCSKTKVKSHDIGAQWVSDCLAAHPGTSCKGKPWTSDSQTGIIWPD